MRINIENASKDEKILEGRYQYIEGGETEGNPSFHIFVEGKEADYEIYFYFDSKKELREHIEYLESLEKAK